MLNAIQQLVDASNARSVFDSIDDNKSGRVSADELSKALIDAEGNTIIGEAQAEEEVQVNHVRQLIRRDERYRHPRPALARRTALGSRASARPASGRILTMMW